MHICTLLDISTNIKCTFHFTTFLSTKPLTVVKLFPEEWKERVKHHNQRNHERLWMKEGWMDACQEEIATLDDRLWQARINYEFNFL